MDVGGKSTTFRPGQCNNSYIFPGVGLAITACKLRPIPDECFAVAADVSLMTVFLDLGMHLYLDNTPTNGSCGLFVLFRSPCPT